MNQWWDLGLETLPDGDSWLVPCNNCSCCTFSEVSVQGPSIYHEITFWGPKRPVPQNRLSILLVHFLGHPVFQFVEVREYKTRGAQCLFHEKRQDLPPVLTFAEVIANVRASPPIVTWSNDLQPTLCKSFW